MLAESKNPFKASKYLVDAPVIVVLPPATIQLKKDKQTFVSVGVKREYAYAGLNVPVDPLFGTLFMQMKSPDVMDSVWVISSNVPVVVVGTVNVNEESAPFLRTVNTVLLFTVFVKSLR